MKFILGKKIEMTQVFKDDGTIVPATKVMAGPCYIIQVKASEGKDKYDAVKIGFGQKKKLSKSLAGQIKNLPKVRHIKEFRVGKDEINKYEKGQEITVVVFEKGDKVSISGVSKGKGFAGVVKRHGFAGSPATHGHKDQLRHSGSIGAGEPQRVFKGIRMGGRMGAGNVTVKNLEIIDVDPKNNILIIKGALPGSRNSLVAISAEGEMDLQKKAEVSAAKEANPAARERQGKEEVKVEEPAPEPAKTAPEAGAGESQAGSI